MLRPASSRLPRCLRYLYRITMHKMRGILSSVYWHFMETPCALTPILYESKFHSPVTGFNALLLRYGVHGTVITHIRHVKVTTGVLHEALLLTLLRGGRQSHIIFERMAPKKDGARVTGAFVSEATSRSSPAPSRSHSFRSVLAEDRVHVYSQSDYVTFLNNHFEGQPYKICKTTKFRDPYPSLSRFCAATDALSSILGNYTTEQSNCYSAARITTLLIIGDLPHDTEVPPSGTLAAGEYTLKGKVVSILKCLDKETERKLGECFSNGLSAYEDVSHSHSTHLRWLILVLQNGLGQSSSAHHEVPAVYIQVSLSCAIVYTKTDSDCKCFPVSVGRNEPRK